MKKIVVMLALVVGVLLFPAARDVSAQSATVVTVPFSFIVQGTVLPAGQYRIDMRREDPTTMRMVSTIGGPSMFVNVSQTVAATPVSEPSVVFVRIGNANFLSRVIVPGENVREIAVPAGSVAAGLAMRLVGQAAPRG